MWFLKGSPPTSSTVSPRNTIKTLISPLPYLTQNRKLWDRPVICFNKTSGDSDTYRLRTSSLKKILYQGGVFSTSHAKGRNSMSAIPLPSHWEKSWEWGSMMRVYGEFHGTQARRKDGSVQWEPKRAGIQSTRDYPYVRVQEWPPSLVCGFL